MTTRYDILVPRPGKDDKTYWTRIGTAFEARDGGMNLIFDALPLPGPDGKVTAIVRQAKDLREAAGTGRRTAAEVQQGGRMSAEIDDGIPF